ncbi:hypothetical protein LZ30DRAFT_775171 [Colletotrichum cereale]|nr:hypothetical protein LZ30DRAFT_775171 [Colletotrichum cereale]
MIRSLMMAVLVVLAGAVVVVAAPWLTKGADGLVERVGVSTLGTTRLAIARRLIHLPDYIGGSVGLENLANLAAASRAWQSLITLLLYAEAVLSDYTFYAAKGGLAYICWYSDLQRERNPACNTSLRGGSRRATWSHLLASQTKVYVDQPAYVCCFCLSKDPFPVAESWGLLPTSLPATALHLAVLQKNDKTAKLLILSGAVWDRPFTFSRGVTAFHLMAANNAVETMEWIASDTEAWIVRRNRPFHDWPDDSGRSSFHHACLAEKPSQDNIAASRLVQALMPLGALLKTGDNREVAQRLAAETERVRYHVVQGWPLTEADSDQAWALRLSRGDVMIRGLWASRVSPVEYAVAQKNYRMVIVMLYAAEHL